jgi:preprotein translocase subunit SecF
MELFKRETRIDFARLRKPAYAFSIALLMVSILSLTVRGLNFGIDFTGGTLLEVGYPVSVELSAVRADLDTAGVTNAVVQHFGTSRDVLIRLPLLRDAGKSADTAAIGDQVLRALRTGKGPAPELRRVEFVGPQVGGELVVAGTLAVLIALAGIMVYIWFRFEHRLAIGAVAATIHDPFAIAGFFSLTGMEFDLTVLAGILAVIGYSVNDTIVVFDRIRENFRRMRKAAPAVIINASINQTLSRTIMTSGTTLLVVIALLLLGGPLLRGFSTALLLGVVIGTYSSIYVASAAALDLGLAHADLALVHPETGRNDQRP